MEREQVPGMIPEVRKQTPKSTAYRLIGFKGICSASRGVAD